MRYVTLVAWADDYDTTPGLIVKGTPKDDGMMADRRGEMIAHDIVEHQNGVKAIGPVWDELEALGGAWHSRGRHGDIPRRYTIYTPHQHIASDVTRMFNAWCGWAGPGKATLGTRASDYDEDFQEILDIARRDIPREFNGPRHDSADIEAYLSLALRHMRIGYRKAERRWGGGYYSNTMYHCIREAVALAQRDVAYEGQEFRLGYGNGEARCTPIWEDY